MEEPNLNIIIYVLVLITINMFQLSYCGYTINNNKLSINYVLSTLLTIIILYLNLFNINSTYQYLYLFIINFLVFISSIINTLYYRYYRDVISIYDFISVFYNLNVKESIINLFKKLDLLIFATYLTTVVIILKTKSVVTYSKHYPLNFINVMLALMFIIALKFLHLYLLKKRYTSIFLSIICKPLLVSIIGLIDYHLFDIFLFLFEQSTKLNKKLKQNAHDEAYENFNNIPNQTFNEKFYGMFENKNIITIQVEALQNFIINNKAITPKLNALIEKSMYFTNIYSQVAGGNTADAEFILNTSLFPSISGSVNFKYIKNNYNSFAKKLKLKGYTSVAFHGNKGSFWNRSKMYSALGFDKFYSSEDLIMDDIIGLGLSDKSLFKQVSQTLRTLKQPFYASILTLTSHYPFNQFATKSDQKNNNILENYCDAMHYVDEAIGDFIDDLEINNLWENSIIVIYGDHNAFTVNDMIAMNQKITSSNNKELIKLESLNVPLIIHCPHDENKGSKNNIGGQIDILPTISNLLGLQNFMYLGSDLLNTDSNLAIMRDGSFINNNYYYSSIYSCCYEITSNKKVEPLIISSKVDIVSKKLKLSDDILKYNIF